MRHSLLAVIVGLVLALNAHADTWVDQGNGTWTLSVTYTLTTQQKNMAEQIRADHNYTNFYAADAKDASGWLQDMLLGFTSQRTRAKPAGLLATWWRSFVLRWVTGPERIGATEQATISGLAVTVPTPVAAP